MALAAAGGSRGQRAVALVVLAAVALLGTRMLAPGSGWVALVVLLNAIAVVALAVGISRHHPVARTSWMILLATQACSFATSLFGSVVQPVTGTVLSAPSVADGLFLAAAAGNCLALAMLARLERGRRHRETLLDILIATVSLTVLFWVFLIQPFVRDADHSIVLKLASVAYPTLGLLPVALSLGLVFSGARPTPAKLLLLAWSVLQVAGNTAYAVLVLAGERNLTDAMYLPWMAAFACLAAVGLHPTMRTVGEPTRDPERSRGRWRRLLVFATVLVLPAVLTIRVIQEDPDDLAIITCASVLVFLLAMTRGITLRDQRMTRSDHVALLRLIAGFVVGALLPLALMAESSIRLTERIVANDAQAQVRTTSTVSAQLVQKQMEGLAQLVAAYAERRLLAASLGDGTLKTFDKGAVNRHLVQLQAATPTPTGVFVADTRGRLGAVLPSTPSIIGNDFSFRDWYRGVTLTQRPYVSEAYTTAIKGGARVVAVAAQVRRPVTGEVLGVLVAVYDLQAIQRFSEELASAQGVSLRITDQRGTVVASPGADGRSLVDATGEPGVSRALLGTESLGTTTTAAGEEVLSAYAPVPGLGWTVTAQVPTITAYASLKPLRSTVFTIAVLLGQILLGGLVLMARAQRQRQAAERNLLEREESTRGILEAAADAFVAIDADGIVTSWSGQSQRLFGWTAEQACGLSLADLIVPAALRQRHNDALSRLAATGVPTILGQRIELSAMHSSGHEFPVELVIWQSEAGRKLSFNAFIHDISDRKQHEAQLAAARDEALEASRVKTEFLAVMSHELRTPMNGVMGMTSLLLGTELSGQQRDYAETVRTSADSLLELLNDILDLSKVEADRMELEVLDFDLRQLVRDVVQLLEVGAREKDVALAAVIDDDVRLALRGDAARLRQILFNLAGNAVKFTSVGSVHLRVLADTTSPPDARSDEQLCLRFEITDTGIGIAPEAHGRLFEPFSQADASTTRSYGGTGLGLAISKNLVALFDGEIGVHSRPGEGSTFWFTAHFSAGTPIVGSAAIDPAATAQPAAAPALVLVVDDNATNQKIAVRMLENLGHRADVAANGAEAVEAWARVPYDLILMDCRMPVMDGYEATEAIRTAEAAGRRTPIVAMTASAMADDRQRCLDAGMDDFLSKPVQQSDVNQKVNRWLGQRPTAAAPAAAVSAPGPEPAAAAPVLDEAVTTELQSFGREFLTDLVDGFVDTIPDRITAIRTAAEAQDAAQLVRTAHVLRGSAANMGGVRVAAVCARLEEAAHAGRLADTATDLRLLDAEGTLLVEALVALIEVTV